MANGALRQHEKKILSASSRGQHPLLPSSLITATTRLADPAADRTAVSCLPEAVWIRAAHRDAADD